MHLTFGVIGLIDMSKIVIGRKWQDDINPIILVAFMMDAHGVVQKAIIF